MQTRSLKKAVANDPAADNASNGPTERALIDRERLVQRARARSFGDLKLHNPQWDMIVELVSAHQSGRLLSVSDLCRACDAPESTALRHIGTLISRGYAERFRDFVDLRRSWVTITAKGQRAFADFARSAGKA